MEPIVSVRGLEKTYEDGYQALTGVDLEIRRGELFALLGPNGAGKTTLIGIICGLIRPSAGEVSVGGHDIMRDYRAARQMIGLVPQELATDLFETPRATLALSQGLFNQPHDPAKIEKTLRDLSLWDKRDAKIMSLSGGMKRRLLIAKALVHDPKVLFLDEPTAGVDVELRRDMWALVRELREQGMTVILTTHYIEEAEEMADRIGVINQGRIMLVEEKHALMQRMGQRELVVRMTDPLDELPADIDGWPVTLSDDRLTISYVQAGNDGDQDEASAAQLLRRLARAGVDFKTVDMHRSSLEDIFVNLVGRKP